MYNIELTNRLINRIKEVEKFNDIAELSETFQVFCDELTDWSVNHIGGVDLYSGRRVTDPETGRSDWELNQELCPVLLDEFFSSFGYTTTDPSPFYMG